jgi:hypothetical protein
MMITLCRIVPSILFLLWGASAQNAAEQALRDMHIGMQGLQQAASDPAMMAQLMADLQVRPRLEPEIFPLEVLHHVGIIHSLVQTDVRSNFSPDSSEPRAHGGSPEDDVQP